MNPKTEQNWPSYVHLRSFKPERSDATFVVGLYFLIMYSFSDYLPFAESYLLWSLFLAPLLLLPSLAIRLFVWGAVGSCLLLFYKVRGVSEDEVFYFSVAFLIVYLPLYLGYEELFKAYDITLI